ncbi:hypothetical protein BABINDRAFT_37686 [Babjeviella inositovora NRRL Y-12698]|uniref:ATP-dependent 6-phosphofructokinase n=1 Tax=Babjeviella inositovora NRRL Y-12698 TaxID=984486 RepID=A0A1E3QP71_9ASCO|nr:uncharacterized protein BABINDRAFT_37686 [Babjeviella inositovora NRRL Y-12698]ODQ79450.1 hypothetical protein BABINDRAFT_37686 [Babjeviella inositovora NRRL Y-12698]
MPGIPSINGESYTALYASTAELAQTTVDFYVTTLDFFVKEQTSGSEGGIFWLTNPEYNFWFKVAVTADAPPTADVRARIAQINSQLDLHDWRSIQSSFTLKTTNIHVLIERLRGTGAVLQVTPDEDNPIEVYAVDPLGNVIGFSAATVNSFAVIPPFTYVPPLHVSSLSTATPASRRPATDLMPNMSSASRRNVAVMTSGGDAPGMNANVRAIIRTAIFSGCKAFAIYEGYEGLVAGGKKFIREMGWEDVRGWLCHGGTNIGTARSQRFREREGRLQACKNLIDAGIDALIVCGGDGSLTGADLFRSEWPELIKELHHRGDILEEKFAKHKHLNICGTVGSIDNDMASTDATIGAFSSLARICQAIDYIDATANSHSRAFIVEVMGRHCGWLALMAGIATCADYILIPEKPASSQEWQDQMCSIIKKRRDRGRRKTIVIVAEGAIALDLSPITSKDVLDVLVDRLGLDTRITTLGHVQRGGTAVAFDRMLATMQGVEAVKAVLECTPETPSPMIAIDENKIVRRSLMEAVKITKSVATAIENKDFKHAMELRDTDFVENLGNFMAINSANHNPASLPEEKRLKIAIINVGAPAGGMNSAVYSMASYCMSRGHVPYAIHNGFSGLARHESVRSLDWLSMDGWNSMGGSEIGTNRTIPSETDIGMIAYYFSKYQFDGLVLVGGFEAFESLQQLEKARIDYSSFRIPMVLIPATISNNVPGTEYSLGSDTCLNSLMDYCDVIKQSASSTRDRVFVVEIQGGNSGYIATYASLITGAYCSYVPEEGISLAQLECDIDMLKDQFGEAHDLTRSGKLVLKSANASKVLTTPIIAKIMNEEGGGGFEAKTAVPGHVQQGGIPSAMDRTRAARLAVKAVQFIEERQEVTNKYRNDVEFVNDEEEFKATASVLGIIRSHIRFSPIRKLYDYETELGRRMPKRVFWSDLRKVSDQLVGRVRLPE